MKGREKRRPLYLCVYLVRTTFTFALFALKFGAKIVETRANNVRPCFCCDIFGFHVFGKLPSFRVFVCVRKGLKNFNVVFRADCLFR